ncbi:MAG: fructose-bisphosphate aldolase, class [Pseudonocardiales bacterium]|nr:fructose-bisphosphate aldolase, class [Pseudonocardiales bacterium]
MPLVTTRELVDNAATRRIAVGAFNVITLEHAEAVIEGAERANAPVILQISENAVRFHHGRLAPIAAAAAAVAEAASVPASLHLDHVEDVDLLRQAGTCGMSSVMYDASKLDYDKNVEATRAAREWAHANGLYLEAELGEVGGKDGAHAPGVRTDPLEAAEFVAATGVDALAVAVGSSHAMTDRTATLDHELIAEIACAVPVPLVLHGSSGVPDAELARAVRAGITKVNIGTILNVEFTAAVRATLRDDERLVDPRKYLRPARTGVAATVAHLLSVLSLQS